MAKIINIYNLTILSGRKISLEQTLEVSENNFYSVKYRVFGATCTITDKEKSTNFEETIHISSYYCKLPVCKEIKKAWNVVCKPDTNLFFKISKEDFEIIKTTETEFYRPREEQKAIEKAEKDAMPKFIVYRTGVNWGDYSIDTYSEIIMLRNLTERELSKSSTNEQELVFVENVMSNVVNPESIGIILTETFSKFKSDDVFLLTTEQCQQIIEATKAKKELADAEKAKVEADKEAKRLEKAEKEKQEKIEVEQNELMLWNAGVIYSQAGNKMLHSLAASFSENIIEIYTTTYSKDIPNANTTYSIKEELKKAGFKFNATSKNWEIENTEARANTVIEILKKYDTKVWPHTVGMQRCWECGTYSTKLDADGYCGC